MRNSVGTSRVLLTCALIGYLSTACSPSALSAESAAPTPAHYDQWQPQIDPSDSRLDAAFVSISEPEITVADLLARLSEQAGVELTSLEQFLPMRVTAFAQDRTLSSLMSALAHLLGGYWAFPRARSPETRDYHLLPHDAIALPYDVWEERFVREMNRAAADARRPEREQRMTLYQDALSLTPNQLLERYEQTDPWLCADLLNPATRPMLDRICALSGTRTEQLLARGGLSLPLKKFDAAFQQHLAHWSKARWGRPQTMELGPDPDRLSRFTTPEERWQNAVVRLWWSDDALQLQLDLLPDVARFDAEAVHLPSGPPIPARRSLVRFGHREDTPEYREAATEEARAWAEAHPRDRVPSELEDLPVTDFSPPPNQADPRLGSTLDLSVLQGEVATVPDLLAQTARQCGLAVLSNYLPPDQCRFRRPPEPAREPTLRVILNDIRRSRGGTFSWNFHGNYLVATDAEARLIEAGNLPEATLAELQDKLGPASSISADDLGAMLASLSEPQVTALLQALPATQDLPLYHLRYYCTFDAEQRDKLGRPEGLPLAHLSQAQQREVLRTARNTRPWLETDDLSSTVLRTIPRKLSTGQDGISFIIEYHFPDSPNDRDILFTSPLQITLPPA